MLLSALPTLTSYPRPIAAFLNRCLAPPWKESSSRIEYDVVGVVEAGYQTTKGMVSRKILSAVRSLAPRLRAVATTIRSAGSP